MCLLCGGGFFGVIVRWLWGGGKLYIGVCYMVVCIRWRCAVVCGGGCFAV